MRMVKCNCGYEQNYKGKNPKYYHCSRCLSTQSIRKAEARYWKAVRERRREEQRERQKGNSG